jgi:dynein heavy chain
MRSIVVLPAQKVAKWASEVDSTSSSKLDLPLLRRYEETHQLVTNFDPARVRLLREVKYFLLLGLSVPDSALDIVFQSADTFCRWTGNLDLMVNMNNSVLKNMLPVERPLVDSYLTKFDLAIQHRALSL